MHHSQALPCCGLFALLALATVATGTRGDEVGIAIGKKAPGFKLSDQDKSQHTLQELLKKGPVAAGLLSICGLVTVLQDATGSAAEGH